jgi:hypothetical protein
MHLLAICTIEIIQTPWLYNRPKLFTCKHLLYPIVKANIKNYSSLF